MREGLQDLHTTPRQNGWYVFNSTYILVRQTPCATSDPTSGIPFLYRYFKLVLCIIRRTLCYTVLPAPAPEEYTLQTTGAMNSQTFLDDFSFFVMV